MQPGVIYHSRRRQSNVMTSLKGASKQMQMEGKKTRENALTRSLRRAENTKSNVKVSSSVHTYLVLSSAAAAIASPVQRTTVGVTFKSRDF